MTTGNHDIKLVLKRELSQKDIEDIRNIENACKNTETLYPKIDFGMLEHREGDVVNDIFYYDKGLPVAYLGFFGICSDEMEITGMVRPEYRRKGIFSACFREALSECRRRGVKKVLLIAERDVHSGSAFAKNAGMTFEHSEYGMRCEKKDWREGDSMKLIFRKATVRDIKELAFIDMMCFGLPQQEAESYYRRIHFYTNYIAEFDAKPVGKVGVAFENGAGHVFGLGVAENFRGHGYGRETLDYAMDMIFENGAQKAVLEVEVSNRRAISLYHSCGFAAVTQYDYYELPLQK